MFKYWIRIYLCIILLTFQSVLSKEISFVSLSPSLTEIIYALGAEDMLKAVSSQCSYPERVREKPIIGDYYYINSEMLLKIKPDYILAPDSSEFIVDKYRVFGIKPLCYKYPNIEAIYENIKSIGRLTKRDKEAEKIIEDIKGNIYRARKLNKNPNKKILYVVSMEPFMVVGGKSFITDVIEKSGNISVTKNINTYYPVISMEYAVAKKPDIIVLDYYCFSNGKLEKLFPNTKIINMTKVQSDIIDRPAARIYKSVEFFAKLQ